MQQANDFGPWSAVHRLADRYGAVIDRRFRAATHQSNRDCAIVAVTLSSHRGPMAAYSLVQEQ